MWCDFPTLRILLSRHFDEVRFIVFIELTLINFSPNGKRSGCNLDTTMSNVTNIQTRPTALSPPYARLGEFVGGATHTAQPTADKEPNHLMKLVGSI